MLKAQCYLYTATDLVFAPNGAWPRRFPLFQSEAKVLLRRRGYRQRFKGRVQRGGNRNPTLWRALFASLFCPNRKVKEPSPNGGGRRGRGAKNSIALRAIPFRSTPYGIFAREAQKASFYAPLGDTVAEGHQRYILQKFCPSHAIIKRGPENAQAFLGRSRKKKRCF